jgi:hypothetical protein
VLAVVEKDWGRTLVKEIAAVGFAVGNVDD